MSLVLILFQLAFGRGVSEIRHSGLSLWAVAAGIPFAYAWLLLEVGLVEEFFFRVLLQSRLTAFLRSETAGILLMALLFGLAHAPGLHYRTAVNPRRIGAVPTMVSGNRIFGSHNFRRRDFLGSAVGANKKHSGCDACPRGRRSGPQLG
jgi:membrane protease YdiL (CAAX protease family)